MQSAQLPRCTVGQSKHAMHGQSFYARSHSVFISLSLSLCALSQMCLPADSVDISTWFTKAISGNDCNSALTVSTKSFQHTLHSYLSTCIQLVFNFDSWARTLIYENFKMSIIFSYLIAKHLFQVLCQAVSIVIIIIIIILSVLILIFSCVSFSSSSCAISQCPRHSGCWQCLYIVCDNLSIFQLWAGVFFFYFPLALITAAAFENSTQFSQYCQRMSSWK